MGKFSNLVNTIRRGNKPSVAMTHPEVKQALDWLGLDIVSLDKSKNQMVLSPRDMNIFSVDRRNDTPSGFFQYWMDEGFVSQDANDIEIGRKARYEEYRIMDDNSAEASLSLDTYADESLASGRTEESPVKIYVSDKKLGKQALDILKAQNLVSDGHHGFTTHRSSIRTLAKYGDVFHQFVRESPKSPIQIQRIRDPAKIKKIWEPKSQTCLLFIKQDENNREKERLFPWEVSHYAIPDDQFYPYGRSILEPMRSPYKQLIINEALMALSRSSKVERLVIKVPTSGSNPASVFSQLITAKSQMKNAVFGTDGGVRSKSRIQALTDILWMPGGKEYGIDRLQSNIDISSTDDVEYFRDKMLMSSRLPKSYLLADNTQRIEEGALAMQDLKFSRALLPLQHGYAEGLTWEITALLVMLGADLSKVNVRVSIDKPQSLSRAMVSGLDETIRSVDSLIESFTKATKGEQRGGYGGGDEEPPEMMAPEKWVQLMRSMTGLSSKILNTVANLKTEVPAIPIQEQVDAALEAVDESFHFNSRKIVDSWGSSPQAIKEFQLQNDWRGIAA